MSKEKHLDISTTNDCQNLDKMGMSGYSKFAWKLWNETKLPMTQCITIERIVKEQGCHTQGEIVNDLWQTRIYLVELYHKYRNHADKRRLGEKWQMFYQGRAEAIWECIHELDKLTERYNK